MGRHCVALWPINRGANWSISQLIKTQPAREMATGQISYENTQAGVCVGVCTLWSFSRGENAFVLHSHTDTGCWPDALVYMSRPSTVCHKKCKFILSGSETTDLLESKEKGGTAGSDGDQMDTRRTLHHFPQISKTETYCSFSSRNQEGGVRLK